MFYEPNEAASDSDFVLLVILTLIPLFALAPFWLLAVRRTALPVQSLPVRYAHFFVRVTPPVFTIAAFLYAALDMVFPTRHFEVAMVLHVAGSFFLAAANIGVAIGLYFVTIANRYVTQGPAAWWKMLRLEAWTAGILLLVVGITFFAGGITLAATGAFSDWGHTFLNSLSLTIDVFQFVATIYVLGTILHVMRVLKKENDILFHGMGKVPVKILGCSLLWIARCAYDIVFTIKAVSKRKVYVEPANLVIPTRMIDFYLAPAVLIMLIVVVRDDVWADGVLRPDTTPPRSPKVWLYDIGRGILETFRGYMAVFSRKQRDPAAANSPAQEPAHEGPEIPLDTWEWYIQQNEPIDPSGHPRPRHVSLNLNRGTSAGQSNEVGNGPNVRNSMLTIGTVDVIITGPQNEQDGMEVGIEETPARGVMVTTNTSLTYEDA